MSVPYEIKHATTEAGHSKTLRVAEPHGTCFAQWGMARRDDA